MRLDAAQMGPKSTKCPDKRPRAPKVSDFVADNIARVENTPENAQARCNTKLLGKYQLDERGTTAVIPPKSNRKVQRDYDTHMYQWRHLVENYFAKI